MELMTRELKEMMRTFPLGSQDGLMGEAEVLIKFFNPYGRGTWYVLEGEEQPDGDFLFFGYVKSPINPMFDEYGYFSLSELESIEIEIDILGFKGIGKIERDLYFPIRKLGELIE